MNPDIASLIARRDRLLGPAYRLFYQEPLHIVKGEGVWLYAADGRKFLDTYNNVPHVGHCHPQVVAAVRKQVGELNLHTRYLHDTVLDYAERLLGTFENALDTAHFCCSGTEANELAIRLARSYTGNKGIIVMDCAYHGHSQAIYEISSRDVPKDQLPDYVATVPAPDTLRGQYQGADAMEQYARLVQQAVDTLQARGYGVAAMIVDMVQSSGGTLVPPMGYYTQVVEIVRMAGGLFIADEVQAGFARVGSGYWPYQGHGITPDFVTMGKPMGNGMPLAACVTQRPYVEKFARNNKYFNTFAGIPVTCAAGLAVMEVLEADQLQQHALQMGVYIKEALQQLATRYECIGDIRGSGFFIGLDLVENRATLRPATAFTSAVINAMKDRGVLSGAIGPGMNVLKIRPPMIFERSHADLLLNVLEESIRKCQ